MRSIFSSLSTEVVNQLHTEISELMEDIGATVEAEEDSSSSLPAKSSCTATMHAPMEMNDSMRMSTGFGDSSDLDINVS